MSFKIIQVCNSGREIFSALQARSRTNGTKDWKGFLLREDRRDWNHVEHYSQLNFSNAKQRPDALELLSNDDETSVAS